MASGVRSSWNHNTHFHPVVLRGLRPGATAVDVGCGEGLLTRRMLAAGAGHVTGLDSSTPMIELARGLAAGESRSAALDYVVADVLDAAQLGTFDLVACVATLHHLGLDRGLERLRDVTAPGGRLVVVGLARPSSPLDRTLGAWSVPLNRVAMAVRGYWEHPAPVRDPDETYDAVRVAAARTLPGSMFRSRLYWRYTIEWQAPD
ncbi:MAG TPA: class I SAM-dependent methyltransferase [Cellulomonas sp.]|uniref:class I SAM-dependent methyltransferase n=1 Tax=Cellulomonas sp. TaxID=40001 RepID=UPI002E2FC780|nr:class I SAM-dependent methyltransferase [Cellulomonas sp.]HEX5332228.1 class I SAM-dependent methyltransferase [Cellulomonas sp.]